MGFVASANVEARRASVRSEIVTVSEQMRNLLLCATRIAASDAKVLITGESGVGKDVLARYIHAHSARSGREYVPVNCGGVAESLLESELFGHVKGSFTGAYRDSVGKLQLAHMGTPFLDEVGEMSPRMQGVLLRFLENGEIQSVGGERLRAAVDVRVVAATNRNLTKLVAAGAFREDLLYRLRVVHLHVPALRERSDDVKALGSHFLMRLGGQVALTDEAWAALARYGWPGNIRELRNVMEQLTCFAAEHTLLDVNDLPQALRTQGQAITPQRERRRQLADVLYQGIVENGYSFWEHIHPMFLNRDITRHDMRELVRRGLSVSRGNYRALLELFYIPASDYKRFMNFLTTHDCRPDFREFRDPNNSFDGSRIPFPALAPGQGWPALETARNKAVTDGDVG
ncbi:MAG: AAA domain-containing protein [Luteitalea sp.]|nr:AAA domain-containing protein [Luteitalea sp.]